MNVNKMECNVFVILRSGKGTEHSYSLFLLNIYLNFIFGFSFVAWRCFFFTLHSYNHKNFAKILVSEGLSDNYRIPQEKFQYQRVEIIILVCT